MKFGSVCSGIEAASVAWEPLGWKAAWFSEIEPFPCAVLKHHYPNVPNLGDMTALPAMIRSGQVEVPDILCGGTPCQAFSVAGLRQSLSDERGNLSLTFCEIADAIDEHRPAIIFWENVPGVLNTKDNAFGCFLAGLAGEDEALVPPGGRWTNAGFVDGPQRAVAWRVLDAQYFGVAQRRRRVFVVASARADFDPAAVLFEFEGVRRDFAPSRETGKVTPTISASGTGVSRVGFNCEDEWFIPTQPISIHPHCIGRAPDAGPQGKEYLIDGSAYCMDSRGQPQAVAQPITFGAQMSVPQTDVDLVQTLQAKNPMAVAQPIGFDGYNNSVTGNIAKTLDVGQDHHHVPIAFHPTQDPISSTEVCHAIGTDCYNGQITGDVAATMGTPGSSVNASGPIVMQPIPLDLRNAGRDPEKHDEMNRQGVGVGDSGDPAHTVTSAFVHGVATTMQVRRLTPVECERLQGFPDNYTNIKPNCPDGPRYKALGNSWAVPVVRWIGERIERSLA